nr:MAG TPA_asm: hypothetical protein [Caudoviricetes sp.]
MITKLLASTNFSLLHENIITGSVLQIRHVTSTSFFIK